MSIAIKGYSRNKKRTKDEIFKDLPVEEVIHRADTICPECQSEMKVIGKEYIREELVYVPSKIFRRKHYAEVVKCPECGEYTDKSVSDKAVIIKGKVPKSVLPKSYCSPELLAHIFYEKYAKAVPLERLSKDFKSMKAEISTATLANWVIEASETYLKPIYQQLHNELLKERVIHADETVLQVLHEENRKAKTQSRMWVYCTDKIKLYQYTQTRNGENAVSFLDGYTGYLVCDGYDGYNKLKNITRCGGPMQEESFMKLYLQMKKSERLQEPMKVSKESTRYLLLKENMRPLALKKGTQNGRSIPERFLTIFTYGLKQ